MGCLALRNLRLAPCFAVCLLGYPAAQLSAQGIWNAESNLYQMTTPDYRLQIEEDGFKFGFFDVGASTVLPHDDHGLSLGGSPITSILNVTQAENHTEFRVQAANGALATVTVHAMDNAVRFQISPDRAAAITTRLSGELSAPAYGLADAAITRWSTNLEGRTYPATRNDGVLQRFGSSFMVHPTRRLAGVTFYPSDTTVATTPTDYSITSHNTDGAGDFKDVDVYYFIGEMPEIYAAYKNARTAQGYPDVFPTSRLFEIGWESWDVLRANANGERVRDAVQQFLDRGYPIRWIVTGSGFWQAAHKTTSFGYLDQRPGEYPDPHGPIGEHGAGFSTWTDQEDLAWLIGQRTAFVTPREGIVHGLVEGPFTREAEELGYFVNDLDGRRFENSTSWAATTPTWILDGSNPAATAWFRDKFELWKAFGIDGVKEDTGVTEDFKRTDVFNGVMNALAESGSLIMARNGVFTMPGTLHRINDTWGNFSDRSIISWLQYAASAAPNVYADSIGFGYMGSDPGKAVRNAWVQALTAGMAFSDAPWNHEWSEFHEIALMKAVEFRHALTPYIYSAAVDSFETGYPHTMTPLYIAFPDDPETYTLANNVTDQYEWMVGPTLLAAPVFEGPDDRIDVYLPEGEWIDFNTGIRYAGGQTLIDFSMPLDRPPIFVGGKGILVQRSPDETTLRGEIYPVAPGGTSYTFTHMDGNSTTTILADHAAWDPARMQVIDLMSGEEVAFEIAPATGAIQFPILADHDYRLLSFETLVGDFNENGSLDAHDIDLLSAAIRRQDNNRLMDLNSDSILDVEDHRIWIEELAGTYLGDADLNGTFDNSDLLIALRAGKYELDVDASWLEGDWTGDHRFDSVDLLVALRANGYERGPRAAELVPEPAGIVPILAGLLGLSVGHRRQNARQ